MKRYLLYFFILFFFNFIEGTNLEVYDFRKEWKVDFKNAKWIWDDSGDNPVNYFVYFRTKFNMETQAKSAELRISADSKYILYLNGKYIGQGPGRAFPSHYQYDIYDIKDNIKRGENVIGVIVHHYGKGTYQYILGKGGLLVEGEIKDNKNKTLSIFSSKEWKTKRCETFIRDVPRLSVQRGFEERYNAINEIVDWNMPGFDDSSWKNTIERGPVGTYPWTGMEARYKINRPSEKIFPVKVIQTSIVKPVPYIITLNLTEQMLKEKKYNSKEVLNILFITSIFADEDEDVTLNILQPYFAPPLKQFRLGSRIYDVVDDKMRLKEYKVSIKKGWNTLIFKTSGAAENEMEYSISIQSKQRLGFSYKNERKDTPEFAMLTGLFSDSEPEIEDIFNDVWENGPEVFSNYEIKKISLIPLDKENIFTENVFFRTMVEKEIENAKPVVNSVENLCISNSGGAIVNSARETGDTRILLDFGKEVAGYIGFEVETQEDNVVFDFNLFEVIEDGDIIHWTYGTKNSIRYIAKKGNQIYRSYERRGFRYAFVTVRNNTLPVKIKSIYCILETFPVIERGSFECSDSLLNRIWNTGKWTLRLCMDDTYVDCPGYEQVHWIADAYVETLVNNVTFAAFDLTRHSYEQVAHSMEREKIPSSYVPSETIDILPAWSFIWIWAVYEHYFWTGDIDFVRRVYPALKKTWDEIIPVAEKNPWKLIAMKAWNFIDWAPMDTPVDGVVTHINFLACRAVKVTSILAEILGEVQDKQRYEVFADNLNKAIEKNLWNNKKRVYIDAINSDGTKSKVISQQTHTVAVLSDIISQDRQELIKNMVVNPPEDCVKVGSPFFLFFVLEALAKYKEFDKAIDLIKEKYKIMLDKGASTWWESFPGYDPNEPYGWARSHCHGYSSGATYFLSKYILGVRSLQPGFKKVEISPYLCNLTWAKGTFPTPNGDIKISWDIKNEIFNIRVEAPKSCECEVNISHIKYQHNIEIKYY